MLRNLIYTLGLRRLMRGRGFRGGFGLPFLALLGWQNRHRLRAMWQRHIRGSRQQPTGV